MKKESCNENKNSLREIVRTNFNPNIIFKTYQLNKKMIYIFFYFLNMSKKKNCVKLEIIKNETIFSIFNTSFIFAIPHIDNNPYKHSIVESYCLSH